MSTHALVGLMKGNDFTAVYVHSDGYLEYTGALLSKHYDEAKVADFVAKGSCSVLGKEIGVKINFNDRMEFEDDGDQFSFAKQCRFYRRDRGESGCEAVDYYSLKDVLRDGFEHVYLMKDGVWYYIDGETDEPKIQFLNDALAAIKEAA